MLALQSASDPHLTTPYPFDVLGAQTQGMIGYWLLQSMQNHLPDRQVAAIINQTLVEAADPAFADPTKFVGEVYARRRGRAARRRPRLVVKADGAGWRRVVGSPRPQRVVETRLIRLLLESGAVVVCAGGGGVPVIRDETASCGASRRSWTRTSPLGPRRGPGRRRPAGAHRRARRDDGLRHARAGARSPGPLRRGSAAKASRGLDGPEGRGGLPLRRADRRHGRDRVSRGRHCHPARRGRHGGHGHSCRPSATQQGDLGIRNPAETHEAPARGQGLA